MQRLLIVKQTLLLHQLLLMALLSKLLLLLLLLSGLNLLLLLLLRLARMKAVTARGRRRVKGVAVIAGGTGSNLRLSWARVGRVCTVIDWPGASNRVAMAVWSDRRVRAIDDGGLERVMVDKVMLNRLSGLKSVEEGLSWGLFGVCLLK